VVRSVVDEMLYWDHLASSPMPEMIAMPMGVIRWSIG